VNRNTTQTGAWLWLTVPILILLAIAAGGGVFINGLYRDNPDFVAQARGQDFISLAVVLPALIITAFLAHRGSPRARLLWLGGLVYLVYTYIVAAFDVKFNLLFLVYVALLGCSLYALIGSLVTTDMVGIKAGFTKETPVKAVSIYLAILVVLFYFMWLGEIVPALMAGKIPQSIQDNGTPTNAVHVLDMAWILPAFGITAINLWRKQALGYTLAGALLSYAVFLILAILGMAIFMIREGHPVVIPQVVIFGALLAISLGMLIWYMWDIKSPPVQNDK
jgi:hypothetical protein